MSKRISFPTLLSLICLSALIVPTAAQALAIDQISFTKAQGSLAVSGTIMVVVRNDTGSAQTITGAKINGTTKVNGTYEWWRAWPYTLQPGEVATVLIHGNTSSTADTPIGEGQTVDIDVLVSSGPAASATGVVLTTSTLRIGNVIPSPDWKTVTIYLRNLDTAACTINSVYLNTEVTSQCTFVSGTTVAANGVGIIEVPFDTARRVLTPYSVRIIATKTTAGDKSVAAPVRLLDPWFFIGTWSAKMSNPLEDATLSTVANYEGLRRAKQLQIDMNFGDNNAGRTKEAVAQWGYQSWKDSTDKGVTPYQYTVGNNGFTDWTDPSTYAWSLGEEMDNSPTGTGNGCSDKVRYANTIRANDANHPTHINFAQQVRYFNKYGWISDIVCQDNYSDATAANANWMKVNCEPTRMVAWTDFNQSTASAYAIMVKFWGQIMYGAKSIWFFKYGGYVPDDGNPFNTYPNQTAGALQAVRELSQVRNLITYSDVSSAVASPSGTIARLQVGKNQVLVVMTKTSSSGSVSGNLVVTMPSWIPISATPDANFNVYRVDQNGMTAQSYTSGSGTVTIPISTVAGEASRLFVIGQPDTEAPAQPRNLCVADRGATGVANKFTLCWNDAWDNIGVMGYKVYNNDVLEGDVRYPMYDTPVLANPAGAAYTVKAYDSQGNLGPASLPVTCGLTWTFTQPDPGDALRPNLDGAAAGWCHDQGALMGIAGGALVFNNPSGGSASSRFISPSALRLPAANCNYMKLRMQNQNNKNDINLECLRVGGGGSWQSVANFNVVQYDSQMRDYVVSLVGRGNWINTIDKVRLSSLAQTGGGGICRIESFELGMDVTPPVTTSSVAGTTGRSGWYKASATVTLTATDAGCGVVSSTRYVLDGSPNQTYSGPFTVSGEGSHSFAKWSVDSLNNTETSQNVSVNIDSTPPVTTASTASDAGEVTVTLTATDATSGPAETWYTVDGGATQSYSGPFVLSGNGVQTVMYWSWDVAGNAEAAKAISSQTITFNNPGDRTYGAAPITLDATASSGLAVSYTVTAGPATVSGGTLTIAGAGSVSVQANQAGNSTYGAAAPVTQTFTVNPKPVQLTGSKVYDGSAAVAAASLSVNNPVGSDTVTVASGTATLAGWDVGLQAITSASGLVLGGAQATNYTFTGASGSVTVNAAGSTTALVSLPNPSTNGVSVTFTATVSSSVGTPTGNVVFLTNGVPLATVALTGGTASVSTADLPVGTNSVGAQFAAQGNYLASSDSLDQVVEALVVYSQTNSILSIVDNGGGIYTLSLQGTPGAKYCVVACGDIELSMPAWTALAGSTNTAPASGLWSIQISNAAPAFYRSVAINPAP